MNACKMDSAIHYPINYSYKYAGGFNKNHIYEYLLEKEAIPTHGVDYILKDDSYSHRRLKIIYLEDALSERNKYLLSDDRIWILSADTMLYDLLAMCEAEVYTKQIYDKDSINHPFPIARTPIEPKSIGYPFPILIIKSTEPISKILTVCGVFNSGAAAKAAGYFKPIPPGYSELEVGKASPLYGLKKRQFMFYMPIY